MYSLRTVMHTICVWVTRLGLVFGIALPLAAHAQQPVLNGRGSGVWDWKRERRVWHPRHTANRYVIDRQFVRQSDVSFNSGKGTLTFGINGRTSILTFFIAPGPDTGATLTFGITLQVEGQSLAKLPGQCETSLAHKYLLFDRFWVGQTLIDLETGESVLGELKLATWIN